MKVSKRHRMALSAVICVAVLGAYLLLVPLYWANYNRKYKAALAASLPEPGFSETMIWFGKPAGYLYDHFRPYFEYSRLCYRWVGDEETADWDLHRALMKYREEVDADGSGSDLFPVEP